MEVSVITSWHCLSLYDFHWLSWYAVEIALALLSDSVSSIFVGFAIVFEV